eukprot:TRINITY_DN8546_c0_g1_i4.p1 TRINITY_DN8546_c0_g1~~TRINITY_DN8546_c0_g1_i4.p1  ORF type:complete len:992 (-),score=151.77 TRINITY_DN8546_c0_g1_i4:34-3009(-)
MHVLLLRLLFLFFCCSSALCALAPCPSVNDFVGMMNRAHSADELIALTAARKCYLQIAKQTKSGSDLYNAGFLYVVAGDYESAVKVFEASHRLLPSWAGPVVTWCNCLQRLHRLEEALDVCERAVTLEPSVELFDLLGHTHLSFGHPVEACRFLQQGLTLSPYRLSALLALANCSLQLNQTQQAVDTMRIALKHIPSAANETTRYQIHHQLGVALLRNGDLPSAFAELNTAASLPGIFAAYGESMTFLFTAIQYLFERGLIPDLRLDSVEGNFGRVRYNAGVIKVLLATADPRRRPDNDALVALGNSAVEDFRAALRSESMAAIGYIEMLLAQGKTDQAIKMAIASIATASSSDEKSLRLQSLARTLLHMGLPFVANRIMMQCMHGRNSYALGYNNFAVTFAEANDLNMAQFYFELALHIDPELLSAHHNLAWLHAQQGRGKLSMLHQQEAARIATELLQEALRVCHLTLKLESSFDVSLFPDVDDVDFVATVDWQHEAFLELQVTRAAFEASTTMPWGTVDVAGINAATPSFMSTLRTGSVQKSSVMSSRGSSAAVDDTEPIIIITACSAGFFDRLRNLVGSMHLWEPRARLYVYDLGLLAFQRDIMSRWMHVERVDFSLAAYPPHVQVLRNYAWKPIVMQNALERFPVILFQDSGQELRAPLCNLWTRLKRDGHLFVVQHGLRTNLQCCGPVGELTVDETYIALGVSKRAFADKPMCAGGIQGYVRNGVAHKHVLLPAVHCAADERCIAPTSATAANHRYDQSVFSVLIHKAGLTCETDVRYWANYGNTLTAFQDTVLYSRRFQFPKSYQDYVMLKDPSSNAHLFVHEATSAALYTYAMHLLATPIHAGETILERRQMAGGLLHRSQQLNLFASSPMIAGGLVMLLNRSLDQAAIRKVGDVMRSALELDAAPAIGHIAMAQVSFLLHDWDEAHDFVALAQQRRPESPTLLEMTADLQLVIGHRAEARANYEAAMAKRPRDSLRTKLEKL